ncbi:MAG: RNA polymerase ECF-type sigma factor, partial [bacterium]
MNDHSLISRIRTGDVGAERQLYDAHVDRIYRLACRMTGDPLQAEELTQESFIRAFSRLAGFRGEASFSTWLHQVALSVIISGLRKRKRTREREQSLEQMTNFDPGRPAERHDLKRKLKQAVDDLSEILKTVLVMYEVEGYSHGEIAEILEIPE